MAKEQLSSDHIEEMQETNIEKIGHAYVAEDSNRGQHKSRAERRLLLKTDLLMVPIAALIYFVAYLDRNSIGLAQVMGLSKNLGISANQYYNCLMMFYVGYIALMWPGNVGLRFLPPMIVLGGSCLIFGLCLCVMSAAQSYAAVLVTRVLIGASQAFIQGLGLYVTLWYKRDEVATRGAIYYSAATISGAFSGLIAYGVQINLSLKNTGREPWRWLFIIEGSMALFVGLVALVLLPHFPDHIKNGKHWLFSPEEIKLAIERSTSYNTPGFRINLRQVISVFKDPKCWCFAFINAGVALGIASVGLFLPTIVNNFGFTTEHTLLFTIIPYAFATVTLPLVCYLSDVFNIKGPFLIGCLSLSCLGYILLMTITSVTGKVVATCLITSGLYPSVVLLVSWLGVNTGGFTKRGTTWALAEIFGQCFSIMGTHVYDTPPKFIKGHAVLLGFLIMAIIMSTAALLIMRYRNKQKEAELREYAARGEIHPHMSRSLEEETDNHINFRYIL